MNIRPSKLHFFAVGFWLLGLSLVQPVFGQNHSLEFRNKRYQEVLDREHLNNHFDKMNSINGALVAENFLPSPGKRLDLLLVEIPVEDLVVYTAKDKNGLPLDLTKTALVVKEGKKFFRFYIHPASVNLYEPLIKKYGVSESLQAQPTASTRTLLVMPQESLEQGLFLKTSLDSIQFGFGRIIPDWEVRRSVLITEIAALTPSSEWSKQGVSIIPEPVGAYVKKDPGFMTYAADNQPFVFQHGLIYRDSSFIDKHSDLDIYPLFSLFAEGKDGAPPLIVKWWREENKKTGIDLHDYLEDRMMKPIVEAIAYLTFHQGLIPDAHGQNVLVGLDPHSLRVKHVFFRDIGSMKVNWLLRWARGLSVGPLFKTNSPQWDFKPQWAGEISFKPFFGYFFNYVMGKLQGQGNVLSKHESSYSVEKMQEFLIQDVTLMAEKYFPTKSKMDLSVTSHGIADRINQFIDEHKPTLTAASGKMPIDRDPNLDNLIKRAEQRGQYISSLPSSWMSILDEVGVDSLKTPYGILYRSADSKLRLALLNEKNSASKSLEHVEMSINSRNILGAIDIQFSHEIDEATWEKINWKKKCSWLFALEPQKAIAFLYITKMIGRCFDTQYYIKKWKKFRFTWLRIFQISQLISKEWR